MAKAKHEDEPTKFDAYGEPVKPIDKITPEIVLKYFLIGFFLIPFLLFKGVFGFLGIFTSVTGLDQGQDGKHGD